MASTKEGQDRKENRTAFALYSHRLPSNRKKIVLMSACLACIYLIACPAGADHLCAVSEEWLSLFCPPIIHLHHKDGQDPCSPWPATYLQSFYILHLVLPQDNLYTFSAKSVTFKISISWVDTVVFL